MLWAIAFILLVLWVLGLVTSYTMGGFLHMTGGAMTALATNSSEADTVGIVLMLLGVGLAGLGLLGRKKIPSGGRYLALGMKEVNLRGASLFQRLEGMEGEHVRGCSERKVEGLDFIGRYGGK